MNQKNENINKILNDNELAGISGGAYAGIAGNAAFNSNAGLASNAALAGNAGNAGIAGNAGVAGNANSAPPSTERKLKRFI